MAIEIIHCGDGDVWQPGWGLDERSRTVWTAAGITDLSGHPTLWRLLELLANVVSADKARLARDVWGLSDYHPHRDDKRIQVAVRRLRELIEARPAEPTLLTTTEEGYALGTQLPMRRVRDVATKAR